MKTRSLLPALGAAALVLGLGACATTDPEAAQDVKAPVSDSGDCADDSTTTSTDPVSLTDGWGRTVELERPATRVAVLEWQQTEDVLSLCVNPVAVADVKGYTVWDTAEALPTGTADVGMRGEPNVDALLATDPDLVIVEAYSADDQAIKQLSKYDIPVLATKGADAADPIKGMKDTFSLIAKATGREERAEQVLAGFAEKIAEAKAAVAQAGVTPREFVYLDGWIDGGNVSLRPFGQGSLVGELGEQLGLINAWTGKVDEMYGLGQTDIEGMTKIGGASILYTGTLDPDGSDYAAEMAKNQIWAALPAVAEKRVHAFPAGIWTFGGPRSSEQVLDAYVDLLTD